MERVTLISLCIALCLTLTLTSPIADIDIQEGELIRQKRVTCDVLSIQFAGFSVGHAACALHCIALKKRGGKCSAGVCICRK
nr:holotricin-1-like [Onthophagus taurus]